MGGRLRTAVDGKAGATVTPCRFGPILLQEVSQTENTREVRAAINRSGGAVVCTGTRAMNTRSIVPYVFYSVTLLNCAGPPAPKAPVQKEAAAVEPVEFESQRYGLASQDSEMAVKGTFESSASTVSAGHTFMLAAHFKISDGYRLSWTNPGAMGKQMSIKFHAPEGFEVGPTMFPGPEKFGTEEGQESYGYDGETAVFAEVRAPETLPPDEVFRFELSAEWLACRTTCLRENLNAYFELIPGPSQDGEGFEEPLAGLLESVPRPLASLGDTTLEWRADQTLAIRASGVTWKDFFPAKLGQPELSEMKIHAEDGELELRFAQAPSGAPVQGVLLAMVDGKPRYLSFDEALPPNDP